MPDRNLEIVRRAWDAWELKDMDLLVADWHEDIEWDLSRYDEVPGDVRVRGIGDVMGLIAQWMASWEVYDTTVEEWTPVGDHVLLVVRRRARQRETGEQADTVAAQVWTLRDDLIMRIASYSDIDDARRVAGADA